MFVHVEPKMQAFFAVNLQDFAQFILYTQQTSGFQLNATK